jgi:hypothetical protein
MNPTKAVCLLITFSLLIFVTPVKLFAQNAPHANGWRQLNYVITSSGAKAHPTIILAGPKKGVSEKRATDVLKSHGFTVHRRGIIKYIESDKRFVIPIRSVAEARQAGKLLELRIAILKTTGLFEYVEPDYFIYVSPF